MTPQVTIMIVYTPLWGELADIVIPNAEEYCRRHGYNLASIKVSDPYWGFEKIVELKRLIDNTAADIVFVMDCDAMITNHETKVEDFISPDFDFYITRDVHGINSGTFILRRSEWSYSFLEQLMALSEKYSCENDAISHYINSNQNSTKIKTLPHPSINSYMYDLYPEYPNVRTKYEGHFSEGQFVLHLPGVGMEKRKEILQSVKIIK